MCRHRSIVLTASRALLGLGLLSAFACGGSHRGAGPDSGGDVGPAAPDSAGDDVPAAPDGAANDLPAASDGAANDLPAASDGGDEDSPSPDGACSSALALGDERAIDTPVLGPVEDYQSNVAVARGTANWLLVWEDRRRGEGGDIFGARLTDGGSVLDPGGIPINLDVGTQWRSRVASGGDLFLVVWADHNWSNVRAARVTSTGTVLDPGGFDIGAGTDPDVAFDGSQFVVVFAGKTTSDIFAARVTPAGVVIDQGGTPVCAAAGTQGLPSISAGFPGTLLVSWIDDGDEDGKLDVRAGRLDSDLACHDGSGFLVAASAGTEPARLAFDGERFWATWQRESTPAGDHADVLVRRIGQDGSLPDPQPLVVTQAPGVQGGANIDFDGDHLILGWHHQTDPADNTAFDIHARRLGRDGTFLDTEPVVVSAAAGQQARPAVSARGGLTLVAWDGESDDAWDIYAARMGADGVVTNSGGQRVSSSANAQHAPQVAAMGNGQLLAFVDRRQAPYSQVLAQHLDALGSPLDAQPHQLTVDGLTNRSPVVAPGSQALAAFIRWNETGHRSEIAATRVDDEGAMDPTGILVVDGESRWFPAAASDGDRFLIVWEDQRPSLSHPTIYGARVAHDGKIVDSGGFRISKGEQTEFVPTVAYGAGVFLVAWERFDDPNYSQGVAIDFAVVSTNGGVVMRGTLGSPDKRRDSGNPKVAFDGANFLIVSELHLRTGWNIHASRVTPSGQVLDPQGIAVTNSPATGLINPAVVYACGSYVVGWQDIDFKLVAVRRLGVDGQLLEGDPVAVSEGRLGQQSLNLGAAPDGTVTAAYERFDPSAGSWRVFHRRLGCGQ